MRHALLVITIIATVATGLFAADDSSAFLVYGDDFMISVVLPKDWNVDMDFAHKNGINGFFYLRDYGIDRSPVGIILSLAEKRKASDQIEDYISWDQKNFLSSATTLRVGGFKGQATNDEKYMVRMYEYLDEKGNTAQYQAYLDYGGKYFISEYISFRDRSVAKKYLPAFLSSVKQLKFMNIRLQKKP